MLEELVEMTIVLPLNQIRHGSWQNDKATPRSVPPGGK
jgi:hypothetical protein